MELSSFTPTRHWIGITLTGQFSMIRLLSKYSALYTLVSSASSTGPRTEQVHNNRTDLKRGMGGTSILLLAGPMTTERAEPKESSSPSKQWARAPVCQRNRCPAWALRPWSLWSKKQTGKKGRGLPMEAEEERIPYFRIHLWILKLLSSCNKTVPLEWMLHINRDITRYSEGQGGALPPYLSPQELLTAWNPADNAAVIIKILGMPTRTSRKSPEENGAQANWWRPPETRGGYRKHLPQQLRNHNFCSDTEACTLLKNYLCIFLFPNKILFLVWRT